MFFFNLNQCTGYCHEQMRILCGQLSLNQLDKQIAAAMQTIALRKRQLEKTNGVYGLVRTSGPITLEPNQSIMVYCCTQIAIPIIRSVVMVHQADESSKIQVTHCLVPLEDQSQELQLDVTNQGT